MRKPAPGPGGRCHRTLSTSLDPVCNDSNRRKEAEVGYSDHLDSGGLAPTVAGHPIKSGGFSLFGWLSVAVVVVLWALFAIALWTSPSSLTDVWEWVDALPTAAKLVVWVIGLPWMAGIAILQSDWPDLLQIALVAGLALGSIWTFWPKRAG